MTRIFVSYRREDSADVTGRINDRLRAHFGSSNVFTDVDSIPFGVDFREHLSDNIAICDVLLAVIGSKWVSTLADREKFSVEDRPDFVFAEIDAALRREIPVIPLLVQGAAMPTSEQLPAELKSLSFRNSTAIRSDPDFHNDVDRLFSHIDKFLNRISSDAATSMLSEPTSDLDLSSIKLGLWDKNKSDRIKLENTSHDSLNEIVAPDEIVNRSVNRDNELTQDIVPSTSFVSTSSSDTANSLTELKSSRKMVSQSSREKKFKSSHDAATLVSTMDKSDADALIKHNDIQKTTNSQFPTNHSEQSKTLYTKIFAGATVILAVFLIVNLVRFEMNKTLTGGALEGGESDVSVTRKDGRLRTLQKLYFNSIRTAVIRQWRIPEGVNRDDVNCIVSVSQDSNGFVEKVSIDSCSPENEKLNQSIIDAVKNASPLPKSPMLFDRDIRFFFQPQ